MCSSYENSGDKEVFVSAAPGTYALIKGKDNKTVKRRSVIGWDICETEGDLLVLPVVPTAGFDQGIWLFPDAVQYPDGHIEALNSGRIWPNLKSFESDKAWPIRKSA